MTACDVPVGVITGDDVVKLLKHAKDNGYAIPAFNCTRCVRRIIWIIHRVPFWDKIISCVPTLI
jgi:hypothetical protein